MMSIKSILAQEPSQASSGSPPHSPQPSVAAPVHERVAPPAATTAASSGITLPPISFFTSASDPYPSIRNPALAPYQRSEWSHAQGHPPAPLPSAPPSHSPPEHAGGRAAAGLDRGGDASAPGTPGLAGPGGHHVAIEGGAHRSVDGARGSPSPAAASPPPLAPIPYYNHKSAERSGSASLGEPAKHTICTSCGTNSTPLWRRDAEGKTICNACGEFSVRSTPEASTK